ncbi:MAG TPA: alpha/beta hydrolase, partial [Candidatus Limnocylindrales bacterium]|nr:alpha/beta hydrolase [Candidatus Limnocylindrales bacterium]
FAVRPGYDQAIADANVMPVPEDVTFPSRDPQIPDAKLAGWWLPAESADAPTVIMVHGIYSCRREANILVPAGMLHRAGFSVLLMDLRDHGDSEGDDRRFSGGTEEHLDVLGAYDWLVAQGEAADRIGVVGMSIGSMTAIIAGGQEPAIRAVWADSPATRMDLAMGNFVVDQLNDSTGLSRYLVPGAMVWARIVAGDELGKYDPITEVDAYAGRSIAFVHGALDQVLPAAMSTELHDRAVTAGATTPDAWIVADAGHTEAVFKDPTGYEQRLIAFFTAALGTP